MIKFQQPPIPWQRNAVVISAETIEIDGNMLPLSYSLLTVVERQITMRVFDQIAWARHFASLGRPLSTGQIQRALEVAHSNRRLTPLDLSEGVSPLDAFKVIATAMITSAKWGHTYITHDPDDGLRTLLGAAETWLNKEFSPLNVICTGVLERARRAGLWRRPGEQSSEYYKRISEVSGPLPTLLDCYRDQEWTDGVLLPTDRMFPVFATQLVYQHHMGGRLLRPPGVSAGTSL